MATKINVDDLKFDRVAYSKQHNIIQIIKYLTGVIPDTVNANADETNQLAELVRDLMSTISDLLDDMLQILQLYVDLKDQLDNFIEDELNYDSFIAQQITEMRNMDQDFLDNTNMGRFLKSLGA